MNRLEQAIPAGIILLVGVWVAFGSYTQTPPEAFLFPRIVSTVFVVLALWVFVQAFLSGGEDAERIPMTTWMRIAPGMAVAFVYVFWAAKFFGFYTASAIAVFILISLYDPAPHTQLKSWIKRTLITAGFIAVMYLLFAVLLNVFTPREILFR